MKNIITSAMLGALLMVSSVAGAAAPAPGETYVYRVSNGYNKLTLGKAQYRVENVDGGRIAVSMTSDVPALGAPRTAIYDAAGNWLKHDLTKQDHPVEYEFSPAYPAYDMPLKPGSSWSRRVNATNPVTGRRNSVRVDGRVVGTERITVPAGSFDTVKISRNVYAGDWGTFTFETNIFETEWYAPSIGRPVRAESWSEYLDTSRAIGGGIMAGPVIRGDWNVFELVSTSK